MAKRINWLDAAKGFGAIYVILGHFVIVKNIKIIIYAFHMPLFFFLAGITLSIKENENFWDFLKKKINHIIIPYLIFSIPLFIYNCIKNNHSGSSDLIIKKLLGIILCWKKTDFYNDLWFLPCIFIAYLISYFVLKYSKKNIMILLLSLSSLVVGFLFDKYNIVLPFCIDTALIAFAYMGIAFISKTQIFKISWPYICLYIPMCIIAFYNYKITGYSIEIYSNDYSNHFLFLLASFCGIIGTIGFSNIRKVENNQMLILIGKESMYLYCAQQLFFNIMNDFMIDKINAYCKNTQSLLAVGIAFSFFLIIILLKIKPLYYRIYNMLIIKSPSK